MNILEQTENYYVPSDNEVFIETVDCDYDPMVRVISKSFYENNKDKLEKLNATSNIPYKKINRAPVHWTIHDTIPDMEFELTCEIEEMEK